MPNKNHTLLAVIGTWVVTNAFNLSVASGWFVNTPDSILWLMWFIGIGVWVWWLIVHPRHHELRAWTKGRSMLTGLAVYVFLGAGIGALVGTSLFVLQRASKRNNITQTNGGEAAASPFYLAVGPTMNSSNRATLGEITAAFEKKGKYTIVPLNVAVYMTVTNLQSTQSMIERYGVEIKTKKGAWVRLTRVESRNFQFYSFTDPHKARQVELILLDNLLSLRWLQTRETVKGWTFFQYPPNSDRDGFTHIFRISVSDAAGTKFVSAELTAENKNNEGVQGAMLTVLPGENDLSHADLKYVD